MIKKATSGAQANRNNNLNSSVSHKISSCRRIDLRYLHWLFGKIPHLGVANVENNEPSVASVVAPYYWITIVPSPGGKAVLSRW